MDSLSHLFLIYSTRLGFDACPGPRPERIDAIRLNMNMFKSRNGRETETASLALGICEIPQILFLDPWISRKLVFREVRKHLFGERMSEKNASGVKYSNRSC